jgi:glucosyl-3-phosphoglycerate synthase
MADFHQTGAVATLHRLVGYDYAEVERRLKQFSSTRRITLILPSLFSELETPALANIVDHLCDVPYLDQIVIGLDRADEEQFRFAREYFSRLPQDHVVIWNDGPAMGQVQQRIADAGLTAGEPGKGRNVWFCLGYVLAAQRADVIALHDCDIITYNRELLGRLVYPVVDPSFSYLFCKGYYPRIADGKLNGRVTRLLVTPLLNALSRTIGASEYVDYLKGFRYPLAGEFAMRTSIVPDIRIPSDWGLEIGILSEVRRNTNVRAICQVDISDAYDHKHQPLSEDNPEAGLSKMSTDITKAVIRKLATDGVVFSAETFRTLKATYYRCALDVLEMYYADARMNGLYVDRHKEEQAIELFAGNLIEAGQVFLENPMETPFVPAWSRVAAADPDIMHHILRAVAEDNA